MPVWCRLLVHCARFPFSLALTSAGNNKAARMAIMAITTNNSIKVKPPPLNETVSRAEP